MLLTHHSPRKSCDKNFTLKKKKTIGTNKQRFDQIVGTIQVGHLFGSTKKIPLIIVGIQILRVTQIELEFGVQ